MSSLSHDYSSSSNNTTSTYTRRSPLTSLLLSRFLRWSARFIRVEPFSELPRNVSMKCSSCRSFGVCDLRELPPVNLLERTCTYVASHAGWRSLETRNQLTEQHARSFKIS